MVEVKINANELVFKAQVDIEKVVRKCTPTSGAIYLHKKFIGKRFRVILIPLDEPEEVPTVSGETQKAEEGLAKLKEDVSNLKSKE